MQNTHHTKWPWNIATPIEYNTSLQWPKITIITPSFNQGQFLEETILSVLNQNYPNLEYMVIDGGSTDNSVDIIKKYSSRLSYWISEKDKGQSDAINKGLKHATGDIFNWLNSDDYYEPGTLKKIAEAFMSDENITCVTARERRITADGRFRNISFGTTVAATPEETIARAHIDQPSTFFRFSAIKQIGPVDESLRYCMCGDIWVRYVLEFGIDSIKRLPDVIVNFRYHESSKTFSQLIHFTEEIRQIDASIAKAAGGEEAARKVWADARANKNYNVKNINRDLLVELLVKKHQPYKVDKTLRYRELAAYFQIMKLHRQGLRFIAKAIFTEPLRLLNYKFLGAYLFRMLAK